MKINCLSCGHKVDLDDVYDDYEGLIKCNACGVLLRMTTQDGHLRALNFASIESQQTKQAFEKANRAG